MQRSTARWIGTAALGFGLVGVLGSPAWADDKQEREIPLAEVPNAARSAIEAQAKGGSVTKVEEITKDRQVTSYEADVTIDGKKHEIKVTPSGELLEFEKK
jgi:hypothetical protein